MNFPHLQGREQLLEPLGFTGKQAEWITLVCLHSGIFTSDQVDAFLRSTRRTAQRFVKALLEVRISGRPVAHAQTVDGRFMCRIVGKSVYRELGIVNVRHRRESSIEVTRRRLLSLDIVLDHPEMPWLPTEQEKVACFEQIGIDPKLLPQRIYAGRTRGRARYFHIKMPIAVSHDLAVFAYIDPGMGTRSELDSWGAAHRELWQELRQSGRRVEVVAATWEHQHLDRARRRLQFWRTRKISAAEQEILTLRRAVDEADWDTLEPHGGLDAAMRKIAQFQQETPDFDGPGMIDDFHLWGSRTGSRVVMSH